AQVTAVQTVTVEPTATRVVPASRAVVTQTQARPTSTPLPLLDPKQLVKARRGDISALLLLNGRVTARQETSLGFGTKGIVDQVPVSQGQSVSAGQVLASLETRDLQQQLSDAQSALQITHLRLQQLQQQTAAQAQALQQAQAQQDADAAKQASV